jgi:type III secretion protein J
MMQRVLLVFFLLLTLSIGTGCQRKTEIVSGIDERQANNIISFLAEQGIPATKTTASTAGATGGSTTPTFSISVPKDQSTEALIILSRNGLPRRPVQNILNTFQKSGLVSSQSEEMIRYQQALGEQIAGTIEQIDGILQAVVQVSFPPPQQGMPGEEQQAPVRASVYVKHQGILDDPNSQLISKIQRLVAASVTGLDYQNVTVVPDRAWFTDVTIPPNPESLPSDVRNYVIIWGMVIAHESAHSFRLTFFSLCLVILVLLCLLVWLIWKFFPTLQQAGGVKALFTSVKPFDIGEAGEGDTSEEEEEEEEEEEL